MKRAGADEQQRWAAMAEELAGVGYWWMEAGSERIRWSPNLFRIFGFEPGTEPPLDLAMSRVHPDDRAAADEALRLALSGRASAGAVRVIWPSGEMRFLEGRNAPELGADGRVTAVYGALIDQTEHVKAEAELAEARDAAQAAATVKADLFANMSHELRTPLTSVIGFSALLSERCQLDSEARHFTDRIVAASRALLAKVNDIFDTSPPEVGQTEIEPRAASPSPPPTAAPAPAAEVAGPPPGARLLIVDDHRVNRELARAMLSPWALEIAEAEDGETAVAAAEAGPFDLILMDVRMPGLDGPGAVARIRSGKGPNRDTPILAFSADADGDSLHGLVDRGFDGVVGKPILAAELVAAVARWVNAPRPAAEATVRERA